MLGKYVRNIPLLITFLTFSSTLDLHHWIFPRLKIAIIVYNYRVQLCIEYFLNHDRIYITKWNLIWTKICWVTEVFAEDSLSSPKGENRHYSYASCKSEAATNWWKTLTNVNGNLTSFGPSGFFWRNSSRRVNVNRLWGNLNYQKCHFK